MSWIFNISDNLIHDWILKCFFSLISYSMETYLIKIYTKLKKKTCQSYFPSSFIRYRLLSNANCKIDYRNYLYDYKSIIAAQ